MVKIMKGTEMAMAVNIGEYHENNNCRGKEGYFKLRAKNSLPTI